MTATDVLHQAEGPFFDDLRTGDAFDGAPAMTLTEGHAALHQAIVGDRLRLPLDKVLSRRVVGDNRPLVHPALVWDVSIGQSTLATHHVMANLFYRGVVFRRLPLIGDTLSTRTEVVALKQNARRPDRPASGLAVLQVTTVDEQGRTVLEYARCAMLPLRDDAAVTGHDRPLPEIGTPVAAEDVVGLARGLDLRAFRNAAGPFPAELRAGMRWRVVGGDVVSSAPELARLTLNIARVHHDDSAGPQGRLVYGGHTIGIALSQLVRALPNVVTVAAWHGCDHTGAVHEGDTLTSEVLVERVEELPHGTAAHLRSRVRARSGTGAAPRDVLDWRLVAVMA